jgi:hypothetical protein
MGTEIAVPFFGPLILIGVAVLIVTAVRSRKRPTSNNSFLGLGRKRVALGYLGITAALVAYSYLETVRLSQTKVSRGDVTSLEASQYFFGWFLNIFCLVTPFMLILTTVVGLPILAALRRLQFASVLGVTLSALLLAAAISLWLSPDYLPNALLAGLIGVGFALPARLPWVRSSAMPANQRLERP